MRRLIGAAALAALCSIGGARAEDTVESLRQPVIDACKASLGSDAPASGPEAACTCIIDGIVKDFGGDALSMLKILNAHLNPSQVKEIAALLAISEKDAQAFVEMAEPRIETIQNACLK